MRRFGFTVPSLVFLTLMGASAFMMKTLLRIPLRIPGHSGIFLVVPIILGYGLVKRFGSASCVGLITGLLVAFSGTGDSGPFKFLEYLVMGVAVDLLAVPFGEYLGNPVASFIVGAVGNLSKMVVNYYVSILLGIPANFILLGIGFSSMTHLVFGGLGGLVASIVLSRCASLAAYLGSRMKGTPKQKHPSQQ